MPSLGLYIRNGEVRQTPIAQNKPASCVELDAERAAQRIAGGETVTVDARVILGAIVHIIDSAADAAGEYAALTRQEMTL